MNHSSFIFDYELYLLLDNNLGGDQKHFELHEMLDTIQSGQIYTSNFYKLFLPLINFSSMF